MSEYLEKRQSLKGIVLVMDIRHPLADFDRMMCDWALEVQMPVHVLLTKSDKFKRGPAQATLFSVKKELKALGDLLTIQTFSSLKKLGNDTLQAQLSTWLQLPQDFSQDTPEE